MAKEKGDQASRLLPKCFPSPRPALSTLHVHLPSSPKVGRIVAPILQMGKLSLKEVLSNLPVAACPCERERREVENGRDGHGQKRKWPEGRGEVRGRRTDSWRLSEPER